MRGDSRVRYGFVIDQNRCIGCHACTVACKDEHKVPVGVFRTWVKYIEKGSFPGTSRHFGVMRCNHCEQAPCIEICPTSALFRRDNGIVDFDNSRCIGCKSCMQACPYDALYIDPTTSTAAKCNFCAHRVEANLEPACVVVCPTQAIMTGDLDDPQSRVSRIVATQKVAARKPHKGTQPKLFYVGIEGDLLQPSMMRPEESSMWADHNPLGDGRPPTGEEASDAAPGSARIVYDVAHPAPWGAIPAAYLWTKSIAAGVLVVAAMLLATPSGGDRVLVDVAGPTLSLLFLGVTVVLLIADLKQPWRFHYLLTKPNLSSWLVWGTYILMIYGALATAWLACGIFAGSVPGVLAIATAIFAIASACYSAFLFAQAKGRDLWQSPVFIWHLLVQALIGGASVLLLAAALLGSTVAASYMSAMVLLLALILGLAMVLVELTLPAMSEDFRRAAELILHGALSRRFWGATVVLGTLVPSALLGVAMATGTMAFATAAAVLSLFGLWVFENIFIEAGQAVPLS
ncbi:MAG TPA: 4Fe-4S dicluster domain-containing protein [Candidatus Binataceae bacterium]|jgi:Fe-S-cluster-containing dehydrogenase component/formate-dependent nitrite reductase membrane component NrfD